MNIDPKLLISLLIFFLSEHMLSKPTYGIIPRPTFEDFVEQIKRRTIESNEVTLTIPTFEDLETKKIGGNNIFHITVESDKYAHLEYILNCHINYNETTRLQKILTSKNALGKTPLRLALDSNKMRYAVLLASFHNKTKTNILEIDPFLYLDALKIKNPDSKDHFYELLLNIYENMYVLNDNNEDEYKELLLKRDDEGNTIYHLILQNKILTDKQKSTLFDKYYFNDLDINLQNDHKKSILDYAVLVYSEEIRKIFKNLGLELPLKLGILKNSLEQLKIKLTKLQLSLKSLKSSLSKL